MGESNKDEVTEINVSIQTNKNPINLLQKLTPEKHCLTRLSESEQPDLNLRLSLGGSYNEIPFENPLIRSSSSVARIITRNENAGELDPRPQPPISFLSLSRSASLPTEAEREKRKIRELQSLRRMEAKRRMLEKQRSGSGRAATEEDKFPVAAGADSSELAAWAAASAANSAALCRAILKIKSLAGNQTIQGLGSLTTAMCLTSSRSLPVVTSGPLAYEKSVRPVETKPEIPSKRAKSFDSDEQGSGMEVMKQMPSVTTTGNGPNGRKIEGFLYKYMKGQVSIVCVCHGSFLSPAEFVKHAGGGEVANPMRHITVCSTSLSF